MIRINKYFIPYIILLLLLGFRGELFISFIIVFFHEIVHYIAARCLGFTGFDVEILPVGTVLRLKELDEATAREDLIISISGPLVNIILAVFFYFIWRSTGFSNSMVEMYFKGNLTIGIFNLIPAFPLDGGRILRALISYKTFYREANKFTVYISMYSGILIMFYYMRLFFAGTSNFNAGIIALLIIISSLKEKERIAYIIMGDIIKKRIRFLKHGYLENKSISIHYKKDLITALGMIDKNKYSIFTVLDDDLKAMDIIYEEEVIEALKLHGNITIEEFIKIEDGEMLNISSSSESK